KARAKILLVDHDQAIVARLRAALAAEGDQVAHVRSAAAAREVLRPGTPDLPDLIILNLVLPDADGLVLCQQLKARPEVGDVPVIVCSARDRTVDRVVALDYGADDFISKPFEVAEVQARVRAVLR